MKKTIVILLGLLVLAGSLAVSCATTGSVSGPAAPKDEESLVVVERHNTVLGVAIPMRVYIDGKYIQSVAAGQTARIIVSNGEHSIWVGSTKIDSSSSLPFMVYHEEVSFFATPKFGLIAADFELTQTGKREL